jgi:hypothetical protein
MVEKAIVSLLIVWGVATIFYQFNATSDFVGRWNYFALVPKWTFFAPQPKTTDYLLGYQDRDEASGSIFEPVIIDLKPARGLESAFRFIWNPAKRNTKAVVDITSYVLTYVAMHRANIARNALVLELYVPYISLLNFVSGHAPPTAPDYRRRFLVLKSFGYRGSVPPVKILESNFHRIHP